MNEQTIENMELMMIAIRNNEETLNRLEDFLSDFTMDSEVKKTVTLELMIRIRAIEGEQEELGARLKEIGRSSEGIVTHEINDFLTNHNYLSHDE